MNAAVAVTGLGAISTCGPDLASLEAALLAGQDGLSTSTIAELPLAARYPVAAVAGALGGGPRGVALAQRAAVEALQMAGIDHRPLGLAMATCTGGMRAGESIYLGEGPDAVHPAYGGQPVGSTAATLVRRLGLGGPVTTHAEACASAATAIAEAMEWIRTGICPAVLVVSVDPLTRVTMSGFASLQVMDVRGCRPFSQERAGMSLGEGAVALVLESAEHARTRGARPLASLLGWGLHSDGHHQTAPEPTGFWLARAIEAALADGGVQAGCVGFVVAHGTGTRDNDAVEAAVLGRLLSQAPVASVKRTVGHTMGASAAFNLVAACLAVRRGLLCATAGGGSDMPGIDVVRQMRSATVDLAMVTCLAFGGVDAAIVVGAGERCA